MLVSELSLRSLIREMLIIEGYKDDQRALIEKYPDSATTINQLKPKWIGWLASRFLVEPPTEVHPFEDAIVTVKLFASKDDGIKAKYGANQQFKDAVDEAFPPDERSWSTPSDVTNMSVDDMEKILGLSERKKQRVKIGKKVDVEQDRIGKVGPWNLWMPTSRERSIEIAGYDPDTLKEKTTWCTARRSGSNLFYNYIGSRDGNVTLFYVIKDNPEGDQDWLSVGFLDGKPALGGRNGGLSVDRANKGLTLNVLKSVLGPYFDEIMKTLTAKNKNLGGVHPAYARIKAAVQSVESLNELIAGLSKSETIDMLEKVIEEPDKSMPVFIEISKYANDSETLARYYAGSVRTPPEVLESLYKDDDYSRAYRNQLLASNHNAPESLLMKLASSSIREIRIKVAANWNASAPVLDKLAGDSESDVRRTVGKNESADIKTLKRLVNDRSEAVRSDMAGSYHTPPEILVMLANDEGYYVGSELARRQDLPEEAYFKIAERHKFDVLETLAKNPKVPLGVLKILADDPTPRVQYTAQNMLNARASSVEEGRRRP